MKTKHGAEFADVRKFISDGQSFTLLTHISPDGDTLGSALALKLLLNALGKTAEVVCSNPVPKIYGFLPESETVKMPEDAEGYCRVIAVDSAYIHHDIARCHSRRFQHADYSFKLHC